MYVNLHMHVGVKLYHMALVFQYFWEMFNLGFYRLYLKHGVRSATKIWNIWQV